jgi:hypothetical protein
MGNEGECPAVWAEYRRRRTLTWAIPLVLIAVAFAFAITRIYDGPWLLIAPFIALGVLQMLWFQRGPCPRCGKPFTEPKRDITYSKQCQHCGLGLWKNPGDVDAYREKQRRGEAVRAAYADKGLSGKRYPLWRKFVRPKPRGKSKQGR